MKRAVVFNDYWSKRLASMPETGMGWQRVDLTLRDGRIIRELTVFNAQHAQTEEEFDQQDIVDITLTPRKS